MSENRFYICEKCGNIIGLINDAGVPLMCCGKTMKHLKPENDEISGEKHIPSVKISGDKVSVSVGTASHPMTDEHGINWVYLETDRGGQRKCLKGEQVPEVAFSILDEKPVAVYAYCNKHGLWRTQL
ncbi:MAG: desulfoferrodoxin [Ruminococcus sp.]|nr:desulfoferrodoxin [Ruminococcus sp.]MBQ9956736.1 desulfoferrodoxin [Ruminococcus sp.]